MKNGWVTKKLGEVCELIGGGTPSIHVSSYYGGDIPWATVRDMNCRIISVTERTITLQGFENSASNIIPAGNLVISTHVGLGKVCFVKNDTAINQDLKGVLPLGEDLDRTFLYYWFLSIADFIIANGTGSTVKGVKLEFVKKLNIPIPPLAEQKSIVAKIDAAFEKIDKLKANAEKNLANAKELFQSALDEAMRPKDGWVEKRLGEVAEIQRGGSPRPIKDFITKNKDGYNWIKIGDVDPSGKFITSTAEKIRKEGLRKTRQVFAGEFLLSNSMSFGRPYILKIDGCIHDGWLVLRGFQKFYKEDFFYHLLRSKWIQNQFNSLAYGSTVRNLNSNSVSNVIVPIVALEEQQEIADSLDRLQSQAGVLQQNYSKQIADCMEMRQAVLREAFEGRL